MPIGLVSVEVALTKTVPIRKAHLVSLQRMRTATCHDNQLGSQLPNTREGSTVGIKRQQLAVIFGVREGFGYSLARRLAKDSMKIILVSRNTAKLTEVVFEVEQLGGSAITIACDVTQESAVERVYSKVSRLYGVPDLVVYGIQSFGSGNVSDVELPAFENSWRHNCLGSFLVARGASKLMLTVNRGTIILVGSTSSVIGREGHVNLAAGRFGQRGMAQVLARELWSKGIHVCHVMIDADVALGDDVCEEFPQSKPGDISETILFVHNQPKSAWTSELDLRPWNEKFWEHC